MVDAVPHSMNLGTLEAPFILPKEQNMFLRTFHMGGSGINELRVVAQS